MSPSIVIILLICVQFLSGVSSSFIKRTVGSVVMRSSSRIYARASKTDAFTSMKGQGPQFVPGVDVPSEIACQNAIYDMVLVERISMPAQTQTG